MTQKRVLRKTAGRPGVVHKAWEMVEVDEFPSGSGGAEVEVEDLPK